VRLVKHRPVQRDNEQRRRDVGVIAGICEPIASGCPGHVTLTGKPGEHCVRIAAVGTHSIDGAVVSFPV